MHALVHAATHADAQAIKHCICNVRTPFVTRVELTSTCMSHRKTRQMDGATLAVLLALALSRPCHLRCVDKLQKPRDALKTTRHRYLWSERSVCYGNKPYISACSANTFASCHFRTIRCHSQGHASQRASTCSRPGAKITPRKVFQKPTPSSAESACGDHLGSQWPSAEMRRRLPEAL